MRNALKVGDNITTIGGIIGDIVTSRTIPSYLRPLRPRPRGIREVRRFDEQHGGKGSCQAEGTAAAGCPQGAEGKDKKKKKKNKIIR